MEVINKFFEWIHDCIIAIPSDIVTSLFVSVILAIITKILKRIKGVNNIIINKFQSLKKVINNSTFEISQNYIVVPSPQYSVNRKIHKAKSNTSTSTDDVIVYIFVALFMALLGFTQLQKHIFTIQIVIGFISVIFMILPILFALISTVFNRIQSSTLKFSVFSFATSLFTYYNSTILPNLISQFPDSININIPFYIENSNAFISDLYILVGLIVLVVEITLNLLLFTRMLIIKIDSLKSFKLTKSFISHTIALENTKFLLISFIVLTILSFVLTSGVAYDFVINFGK